MHIKKSLLFTTLKILLFTLGAVAIFVWVMNTLSQNKTLTTKIITYQIDRLLDLDSEVINPHAYIDWDCQYKIRADKLMFIQDKNDLVALDNLKINVFIPYLLLKKIYITHIEGDNLYVNFERYENKKINIIEIFNITGFFKVYFHNSDISINKYFFKFLDKSHSPNEKMVISGNNILLSKFTLKKYFHLVMDGKISYKSKDTSFYISYNAKIPDIKNKFNIELKLPDFDTNIFKTYVKEFAPDVNLSVKGNIDLKVSNREFIHLNASLKDVYFSYKKIPYVFDVKDETKIKSRFALKNNKMIIDELNLKGDDFSVFITGFINNIRKNPYFNLHIKVDKNSNANSILKRVPKGINVLNKVVDKTKDYNVGGILNGDIFIKGIIGYFNIVGHAKVKDANLGYGYDFPKSYATLDFKKDKLYIDGRYYQSPSVNQFITVKGNVKITKPFFLNLQIDSTKEMDLVSAQKALNIYSDLFNFKTGPVPLMKINRGTGRIKLHVTGTPPNVFLNGKMTFYDGVAGYKGLSGVIDKVYGVISFDGKEINYKDIKGIQDGVWVYAYGNTKIHENGLTHFHLDIPSVPLQQAKEFIDNSPLISNVSTAVRMIIEPKGMSALSLVMISDKNTTIPQVEGTVTTKNSSCNITGLKYRMENVTGQVDFTSNRSNMNFTGITHGINTKLTGYATPKYSDLFIENKNADLNSVYEYIYNSPMFHQIRSSFNDFSSLSGQISARTRIFGNLSYSIPAFYSEIYVDDVNLQYLDLPEAITLHSGKIIAQTDKILFSNVIGTALSAPFSLNGTITDIGKNTESRNIVLKINQFDLKNLEKVAKSKMLTADERKIFSQFDVKSGIIDLVSYINNKSSKVNIKFDNADVFFKPTNKNIEITKGEFSYDNDILKLKNIFINLEDSEIGVNGTITNYSDKKPIFNIDAAANLSEKDFNELLGPLFNLPVKLIGKIYTNITYKGNVDDWKLKARAMLDENSYIYYKDANLGKDLSKFAFFDLEGTNQDVKINTFNVFSPNYTTSLDNPDIIAQIKGKIKNIRSEFPTVENIDVKFNDYMNISFLNILFYNPKKPSPLIEKGLIKGHVTINGDMNNLSIKGNSDVKNAVIPSISTQIDSMNVMFEDDIIKVKDTLVDVAGSKAIVNADFANKFLPPVTINNIDFKSDYVNADKMIETFTNLFAQKEDNENSFNRNSSLAPLIINNGSFEIKEFLYHGLKSKDFSAEFAISPQWQSSIKNLKALMYNGIISGDMDYNFYTTDFSANWKLENVSANEFSTVFLNLPNEVYGNLTANVNLSTKGKTDDERKSNFNGMIYFKLDKGYMLRLGSIEYMLKIVNTIKGGISRLNLNAVVNIIAPKTGHFDTIEGDIQVQNGTVFAEKITSRSNELNLFLTGVYNMKNSIVNATIIGQIPKESKESVLWLGPLGKISLKSVIRKLTRDVENEYDDRFLYDPLAYINGIPGLKANKEKHRFFVVTLKGDLYKDDYVKDFKWIK